MRNLICLLVLLSLSLMTACQSTPKLIVSYEAVEVPAEPKPIDLVAEDVKAEPAKPDLPAPGDYGASDIRAARLGLWSVELLKWGRGLVEAIDAREAADAKIIARQREERAAAKARLAELRNGEE